MAKRRSAFDAFVDRFEEFDLPTQERVLDMCEFVHRRAKRKTPRSDAAAQPAAQMNGQPSLTGLPDENEVES
jgi:hypothetical protein